MAKCEPCGIIYAVSAVIRLRAVIDRYTERMNHRRNNNSKKEISIIWAI
jgi:hypothetical protein